MCPVRLSPTLSYFWTFAKCELSICNIFYYFFRPLRTSSSLKSKPTQVLPDGTIVVPIGSEDDEDGIEPGSDENESKYGTILD